jgi:phosphate transport system permease protein
MSTRPSVQPWDKQVRSMRGQIALVATLPAVIAVVTLSATKWDFSTVLLGVFLPIQLIAGMILGGVAFGKRGLKDAALMVLSVFLFAMVFVLLLSVFYSVLVNGAKILSPHFIYENNRYINTTTSTEYGGLGHAIIGTIEMVLTATIIAVPLGIAIAVYLTQSRAKHLPAIRIVVQGLSGLPSVVAGLFILAFMSLIGAHPAGIFGALALVPLMLPTVARVSEESLKLVPADLQMGSLALGAPNYRTFFSVILPAAKTGIVTALLLGVARILGETAPLVLTTTVGNTTNFNLFEGPMTALPTYIYSFLGSAYESSQLRAWGGALVLLILVGILFFSARIATRNKLSKRKMKK